MAQITASRINDLKAKVKAECSRRSISNDNSTSMATYAGTSYDYATVPAAGVKVTQEHRTKIATPLNAINSDTVATAAAGQAKMTETDIATMEGMVTVLEKRTTTDYQASDCKGGCTGMCYGCQGTCYNACTGCTGTCSGNCTSTCTGTCTGNCTGTCQGCTSCQGCSGTCTACTGCSGTCEGSCDGCRGCGPCTGCYGCSGCTSCTDVCTSCVGCTGVGKPSIM